jgi:hypothetical protein
MVVVEGVKAVTRTTSFCPSQWEGELTDGRGFFVHYRHGILRLWISPLPGAPEGDPVFREVVGAEFDGSMETAAMKVHLEKLLDFSNAQERDDAIPQ